MPKKEQGVNVYEKTGGQQQRDYAKSDMEVLYRRGDWHSWNDEINWLDKYGDKDNELTPGETIAMKDDIQKLERQGVPFTDNPDKAYELAHKNRK